MTSIARPPPRQEHGRIPAGPPPRLFRGVLSHMPWWQWTHPPAMVTQHTHGLSATGSTAWCCRRPAGCGGMPEVGQRPHCPPTQPAPRNLAPLAPSNKHRCMVMAVMAWEVCSGKARWVPTGGHIRSMPLRQPPLPPPPAAPPPPTPPPPQGALRTPHQASAVPNNDNGTACPPVVH